MFRKTLKFIVCGLLVMGIVICVQGVKILIKDSDLSARGAETMGEVESLYSRQHYSSVRGRMVEEDWMIVGYWVDDVWYGNRFKLPRKLRGELESGQLIKVLYDPERPSNGRPEILGPRKAGSVP